jgi:hypothetical protein
VVKSQANSIKIVAKIEAERNEEEEEMKLIEKQKIYLDKRLIYG